MSSGVRGGLPSFVERYARGYARLGYAWAMPKAPTAKRSHTDDGSFTVRGKRANGEGSVYYDPTNRCWWATYRVPGERRERKVRAKTQRAATEKRDDVVARGGWVSRASRFSKATTVLSMPDGVPW